MGLRTGLGALHVLVFSVLRGLLLWLVLPVALTVWALALPAMLLLRWRGREVRLSCFVSTRWAAALLDAALSRVLLLGHVVTHRWPWEDGSPRRRDEFLGVF